MNLKKQFEIWLNHNSLDINQKSNKIVSYLRAIDLLEEPFKTKGLINKSIFEIENPHIINKLYEEAKANQKIEGSYLLVESAKSYGEKGFYSASLKSYKKFLIEITSKNTIYFGSPGTGKSHKASQYLKNLAGKFYERVTFHPDYDYNSFIGGYKPTMTNEGKIAYRFVPQIFAKIYIKAWKDLENQYCLTIEEINRGNCAEIFGDLFQLLDRKSDGSSKYEVTAEEELCKYLLSADGFGGIHEGIKDGKLRFPSNLKIIATMNTSDQSLFPMDSAFKRRWDWEYVPIDTDCKYSDFTIQLNNGKAFKWLSFLKVINEKIYETTKSQDKQIGNWFIDAQNSGNLISESTFVNKVVFYLWNDVFKDEENTVFKSVDDKNLTYTSFFENGTSDNLVNYILEERLQLTNIIKA